MDEIRFSPPPRSRQGAEEGPKKVSGISLFFKTLLKMGLKLIVIAAILAVVIVIGFFGKDILTKFEGEDAYSAVFLSNGQVYFGKMIENSGNEIVLENVYYLQVNEDGSAAQTIDALNQTRFKLVKLGNELHGPTDELFINKNQVVFYEYLRDDSKVVESIKQQK